MKRLFLSLLLMFIVGLLFAQENPENAQYYIDGYITNDIVNKQFVYKLSNVTTQGIYFVKDEEEIARGYQLGERQENEEIGYTFKECKTDYPGGIDATLKFWKQNAETGVWQIDQEVTQGSERYESSRSMTLMLVLDCTESLGSDFTTVKSSAISFLNTLYSKCPNGNINIGIIGFNTVANTNRNVFEIAPLNNENFMNMKSFINGLTSAKNTALYYAMDKAIDKIDLFNRNLDELKKAKLEPSSIVIFTDGLDNHSTNVEKELKNYEMYHTYLVDRISKYEDVGGKLSSYVIVVKGKDLTDTTKFYDAMRSIATENINGGLNFVKVKDFNTLQQRFDEIAMTLISRWRDLICYVPGGIEGHVRWTLGDLKKRRCFCEVMPLLGINVGAGAIFSKPTISPIFSVGLDFAFAVSDKVGIGAYGSYLTSFESIRQVAAGLSLLAGPGGKKFLLGLGVNYHSSRALRKLTYENFSYYRETYPGVNFDLRLGGVFNAFYFFFDASVGKYQGLDQSIDFAVKYPWEKTMFQLTFNLGINFSCIGAKNKQNKK